ncbi:hypothetical protein NQZ68_001439 [Dissostichus eleginoides]|nr:hypothetical protein NQZ68_001439 [Dissostichus eleginoides]
MDPGDKAHDPVSPVCRLSFTGLLHVGWMRNCAAVIGQALGSRLPAGFFCNATTDEIGTCWPRSSTGRIVERPCPEYINGAHE